MSVVSGSVHSCALKRDSSLYCWGTSVGDTVLYDPTLVRAEADDRWHSIAAGAGASHTCAISAEGALYCWGGNLFGQLGNGTTTSRDVPVRVGDGVDWQSVSAGGAHTCAVKMDGSLYCWGSAWSGELGFDWRLSESSGESRVPARVGPDMDWQSVSAGGSHTCAVKTSGWLYCWGDNTFGQLGNGTAETRDGDWEPVRVGQLDDWVAVAAGGTSTCALQVGGTLECWGNTDLTDAEYSEDVPTASRPTPVGEAGSWESVVAGSGHTCAVDKNGSIYCWGLNMTGQVGDGTSPGKATPHPVDTDEHWQSVSLDAEHTCAVSTEGELYCWGHNGVGDLGLGDTYPRRLPTRVGSDSDWSSVWSYDRGSCAITSGGSIHCWGGTSAPETFSHSPVRLDEATDWATLSLGYQLCAIKSDRSLYCRGSFDGSMSRVGDDFAWERVSVGSPSYALKTDGTLYALGGNFPGQVARDREWAELSSTDSHVCAITTTGDLYCWGTNVRGEIGDGTSDPSDAPVRVGGDADWQNVAAGRQHTCAVKTTGALYCWGANESWQLGDGTTEDSSLPLQIGLDTDWLRAAAGHYHTCAIKTDGALYCWGAGADGKVGDGDAWKSNPTLVLADP